MRMPDVNVLVYAHRKDAHREHKAYADRVTLLATDPEPLALSAIVLPGCGLFHPYSEKPTCV